MQRGLVAQVAVEVLEQDLMDMAQTEPHSIRPTIVTVYQVADLLASVVVCTEVTLTHSTQVLWAATLSALQAHLAGAQWRVLWGTIT